MNKVSSLPSQRSRIVNRFLPKISFDPVLMFLLLSLCTIGLMTLYSASYGDLGTVFKQVYRILFAFSVCIVMAQIPLRLYRLASPYLFYTAIALLITVYMFGHIGKGAQRWLNFGIVKFQPSEPLKIILPMFIAWFLSRRFLPPTPLTLFTSCLLIIIPTFLVAAQPDLGTAIIILISGLSVIFLSGVSWRIIFCCVAAMICGLPILWHFMHQYQKNRVLVFLNPERDPLGSGYHILQSKIAIGSGGLFGKGWLHGTQSHLKFLPEHQTDFIFSVFCEEFGFIGCVVLLTILSAIVMRCMKIAEKTNDIYGKLLAYSLTMTFFISFFTNLGMVSGLLPVVGLPLPLMSYGGTATLTMMALFGIMMSIRAHVSFN